jgi:hypothetical protein
MSLAPKNYADLPGRSVRLALNVIREMPGCLDCHDVRRALVALAGAADYRQAAIHTKRGAFVRVRRATAQDYADRVDAVVSAVRAWRLSIGLPA